MQDVSPVRKDDLVPQRKNNEIRTVVIVVIALIVFLLIRRERHFTYRHPSSLHPSTISITRPQFAALQKSPFDFFVGHGIKVFQGGRVLRV